MSFSLKEAFSDTGNCHRKIGRLVEAFGIVAAVDFGGGGLGMGLLAVGGLYAGRAAHNAYTQIRQERGMPPFTRD